MASEYNLSNLRTNVTDYVASVESDFLAAIDNDFITHVADSINFNHLLGSWREPIPIVIESLSGIETALQNALDNIVDYEMPEKPSELDEDIERDVEHVFESDNLDNMESLFSDVYNQSIGNSGYSYDGMPLDKISAISTAMYTKDLDVDLLDLDRGIDGLANKWAADGYDMPPGALSFGMSEMIAAFDKQRESGFNSPATMLANAIQDNIQSAYENGISIEKLHMEFAKKYTAFKYEKIDAVIKAYLGEIDKVKMEMRAPVMNISSILKAAQTDTNMSIEEVKLSLDRELNHLNNWVTTSGNKISTEADVLRMKAEIIEQATNGYIALFSTYGSLFSGVNIQEQSVE